MAAGRFSFNVGHRSGSHAVEWDGVFASGPCCSGGWLAASWPPSRSAGPVQCRPASSPQSAAPATRQAETVGSVSSPQPSSFWSVSTKRLPVLTTCLSITLAGFCSLPPHLLSGLLYLELLVPPPHRTVDHHLGVVHLPDIHDRRQLQRRASTGKQPDRQAESSAGPTWPSLAS